MENRLETLIRRLIHALERANIEEYMRYSASWRRQLLVNFMGGLARGFGMAVGFTILGALMVMLLSRLVELNIPIIGNALAQITRIVLERL
ncbi:MAG: DUF5665 domain-containing protein [Clostridiales bacterium]|nr:DUF5665 domain-containing protein [Clostridiales bacterium]MDY2872946.1 DUF5665 domain-containing protein [Eubacteriales bacterium]